MADSQSFDFTSLHVRDLRDLADIIIGENNNFTSIFGMGMTPINTKHEWAADDIQSQAGQIDNGGGHLAGDTTLNVDDSSVFKIGDILNAVAPDGSNTLERMEVTALPTATSIEVSRGVGSAATAIADDAVLNIVSRPQLENNKSFSPETTSPSTDFNYTQIFERSIDVSRTQEQVSTYSIGGSTLQYQESLRAYEMAVELNRALIWGVRNAGSRTVARRMGGLLEFASATPLSGALDDPAKINDVSELIIRDGGRPDTLVCNTDVARAISAFNSGASNLRTSLDDRQAGSFVSTFVGDTALHDSVHRIVVDTEMPRTMLAVVDSSRLNLNWLQTLQSIDSTTPGQDGASRVMRWEVTASFPNADKVHRVITDITI